MNTHLHTHTALPCHHKWTDDQQAPKTQNTDQYVTELITYCPIFPIRHMIHGEKYPLTLKISIIRAKFLSDSIMKKIQEQ